MKRKILFSALPLFILMLVFLLGVTIEVAKDRTWVTLHASAATGDSYTTVDNSSLTYFGDKAVARIMCAFNTASGTATIDVWGFVGESDNISDHLDTLNFTADNVTTNGKYMTPAQQVDLGGTPYIKTYITVSNDTVIVYGLGN